eukprot:342721_1
MGNGGAKEEARKAESKLDKLVAFIRGIIADDIITDAEFNALDKYRQTESIDNETYEKALSKLGLTLKDVDDKRQKNEITEINKTDTPSLTKNTSIANTYVDKREVHIHHHHSPKSEPKIRKHAILITEMGIIELKEKCKKFGLKVSGNKKELQIKMIESLKLDIDNMSINELKDKCRIFALKMSGNKKEIQNRLKVYINGGNNNNNNNKSRKRALEFEKKDISDDDEPVRKKRKRETKKNISSQRINKMGVDELRETCKEFGLKSGGIKIHLQKRLKQYFNDQKTKNKNKNKNKNKFLDSDDDDDE